MHSLAVFLISYILIPRQIDSKHKALIFKQKKNRLCSKSIWINNECLLSDILILGCDKNCIKIWPKEQNDVLNTHSFKKKSLILYN